MQQSDPVTKLQTVVVNQIEKKTNGIGTTGFVLALIALFLGWIPVLGPLIWFLAFIFSSIGVFKSPYGLAIAGVLIASISFFLWQSLLHIFDYWSFWV